MKTLPDLIQKCRDQGIRLTPQRLAIFEIVREHPGHPSAEEVYQEVLRRHPHGFSFATVYNTLELLVRLGEAQEIIIDELRRRYDVNPEPHHHAVCRGCHRILDIPSHRSDAPWAGLEQADLSPYDFRVESAAVEFAGLCGSCVRADRDPLHPRVGASDRVRISGPREPTPHGRPKAKDQTP